MTKMTKTKIEARRKTPVPPAQLYQNRHVADVRDEKNHSFNFSFKKYFEQELFAASPFHNRRRRLHHSAMDGLFVYRFIFLQAISPDKTSFSVKLG